MLVKCWLPHHMWSRKFMIARSICQHRRFYAIDNTSTHKTILLNVTVSLRNGFEKHGWSLLACGCIFYCLFIKNIVISFQISVDIKANRSFIVVKHTTQPYIDSFKRKWLILVHLIRRNNCGRECANVNG